MEATDVLALIVSAVFGVGGLAYLVSILRYIFSGRYEMDKRLNDVLNR
jgi:hypothetical protein